MEFKDIINTENTKKIKSKNKFINLKSDYFLRKLFDNLLKKKLLDIIKYNNNLKDRINININNYKEYSETYSSIELDIIPVKGESGKFINIKEEDKKYFHIYFNVNKEEIKKTELNEKDNASKINIIIDYQIKSFKELFSDCKCIESINFKKFYRNNVTNMKSMFCFCSSLKELNLSNFNTKKVP